MLKLEEVVRPQDCMVPPSLWPSSFWSFICLVPPAFEYVILGIYSILGRLGPVRESLPPRPARAACHYSHWSSSCWDWKIDTCLLLLVTSSGFTLWHEYAWLVRLRSHAHASAAKAAGKRHLGIWPHPIHLAMPPSPVTICQMKKMDEWILMTVWGHWRIASRGMSWSDCLLESYFCRLYRKKIIGRNY